MRREQGLEERAVGRPHPERHDRPDVSEDRVQDLLGELLGILVRHGEREAELPRLGQQFTEAFVGEELELVRIEEEGTLCLPACLVS